MITEREPELVAQCLKEIEALLGWGDSATWSQQDFKDLADKIFSVTDVRLSPTTLKRIWGKLKYDSAPTLTTLNTLARFLGFDGWRDFRVQKSAAKPVNGAQKGPLSESAPPQRPIKDSPSLPALVVIGILAAGLIFGLFQLGRKPAPALPGAAQPYRFSCRKIVSLGVPNSVVFDYDASAAANDSVFIQQSWDKELRDLVPRAQHRHTSIYYYPGYFQAKLIVGGKIVREQGLFIKSDGWLCQLEQKNIPVYYPKSAMLQAGKMELPVARLQSIMQNSVAEMPYVRYSNIREFGDLKCDNFIFETVLRNEYREGASICQHTQIQIVCEGIAILIPLSAKGCSAVNNLYFPGVYVSGKEQDLSGFGVDFSRYVHLRAEAFGGKARFLVDGKLAYELDQANIRSRIVGIVFRFQGTGAVQSVRLAAGDGKTVYAEDF